MIGGWEFVQAAYVVAYGALAGYGVWLGLVARRTYTRLGAPESRR